VAFAAREPNDLITKFRTVRADGKQKAEALPGGPGNYTPWPKSLSDYLQSELNSEFEFKYFVLDRTKFDANYNAEADYKPLLLSKEPAGGALLKSLIKVDFLSAQRHLSDPEAVSIGASGRAEDLSKRMSRFYARNLKQRKDDHSVLKALFESKEGLNDHLEEVFKPTLKRLRKLGYPGVHNPRLQIKSALNPATMMSQDARVHYLIGKGAEAVPLPDTYSGLGFKNLIYMVVEILDLHEKWMSDEVRPPLHLIFIEEPEAHLHAQLQQVFIRNVLDLLKIEGVDASAFKSQVVVTTHSPHILYERGFKPVRYFRRQGTDGEQTTDVLNLSAFYDQAPNERDFLQRYLKLTHCDLFFADAAILVEGNVERLLLPVMIEKDAPKLCSACICILEVGGAFGHKFKTLVEFLALPVLVITDLDSVRLVGDQDAENDDETEFETPSEEADGQPVKQRGSKCLPSVEGAVTSNQTLIQWLPKKKTIAELFQATKDERIQQPQQPSGAKVMVTYQHPIAVSFGGVTENHCGRTLEEAFGLQNAEWCQGNGQKHLGLKLRAVPAGPTELAAGLNKRVMGKGFDKTKFALGVLTEKTEKWHVPAYIAEGLVWLSEQIDLESPADEVEVNAVEPPAQ
jgi:predicted ATP-dependent endonuclease of OLD family